jgi:hypothetical protein
MHPSLQVAGTALEHQARTMSVAAHLLDDLIVSAVQINGI